MAVNLSPVGGAAAQFFDNSGNILTGGKLYTYAAGTTTPAAAYTTNAGNVAHTNPIILDSAGRVPSSGQIWLTAGVNYKFVLTTSVNVQLWSTDNLSGLASSGQAGTVTATQGQTFVTVPFTYLVGQNSLQVFVNGSKQIVTTNYTETTTTSITFTGGLNVGDLVQFVQ
jgi:hypothetical protein